MDIICGFPVIHYTSLLGGNKPNNPEISLGENTDASQPRRAIETTEKKAQKQRPFISNSNTTTPVLICYDICKKITTLSFALSFSLIQENMAQNKSAEFKMVFVDSDYTEVSNCINVVLNVNQTEKCRFILNGNMGDKKEVFLVISLVGAKENEALRIIPFEMNVTFSADFNI